jgi:hypothetical protein
MARRRWLVPVALSILVAAILSPLSPIPISSAGAGGSFLPASGTLFLQVRGTSDRQQGSAPDHFVYVADVYDMSNQKIGTVTYDAKFTTLTTLNVLSSFHLPNGELVAQWVEAAAPDSTHQGFVLVGGHSDFHDTIEADQGTGDYAGRTGQIRMSGWHDVNKFPQTVALNDFYEIDLHLN